MIGLLVFIGRVVVGAITLAALWFVFDTIHDRNTEVIVSCMGLLFAFDFMFSSRVQVFRLSVCSFLERTAAYSQKLPYDDLTRDDIGSVLRGKRLYLNAVFATLVNMLCLYRLFSSLLGFGWSLLADPVHSVLQSGLFLR
jgi:hypothetical protein